MLLTELLTPERIRVPLTSSSKDDLLRELVELAVAGAPPSQRQAVLDAVREREALLSTGIGSGVAIPHGKSSVLHALVLAAGTAPAGVDFEALDGQPVDLFFLLVGPESAAGEHVKALSRISRLLRRDPFRARLASARDPQEFYRVVAEFEAS